MDVRFFLNLKTDKDHDSEKEGSKKKYVFVVVRSHFQYTRRHTRT